MLKHEYVLYQVMIHMMMRYIIIHLITTNVIFFL